MLHHQSPLTSPSHLPLSGSPPPPGQKHPLPANGRHLASPDLRITKGPPCHGRARRAWVVRGACSCGRARVCPPLLCSTPSITLYSSAPLLTSSSSTHLFRSTAFRSTHRSLRSSALSPRVSHDAHQPRGGVVAAGLPCSAEAAAAARVRAGTRGRGEAPGKVRARGAGPRRGAGAVLRLRARRGPRRRHWLPGGRAVGRRGARAGAGGPAGGRAGARGRARRAVRA
ncbi:hypothetical protein PVAP13_2NG159003 [Panicum virgatum]|uniref:Uncharacterized protein n=1 Tax=Panicum virgatum TaxID=38727 RepID=A0A8T0VZG5_PANVG|nr:hypothetical protein PVAP13_2NG159003 [Panicum virgatum]